MHPLPLMSFTTTTTSADCICPKVDPAVDGEDCNHDCESCAVHFPANFKVEQDDDLYGHVKAWSTHVIVATGKSDWVRDVADEKGSVMEAIDRSAVQPSNGVSISSALKYTVICGKFC